MVCKIHKSHPSVSGTLKYNQDKANKEEASIIGAFNMDEGSETFRDYQRTFERYERMNIRTNSFSFQMSIDPDPSRPEETYTDEQILDYAMKIMKGLGYGKQPILIYEHHDIKRKHYHVISVRTNKQGRKIRDSFEEKRLQSLMVRYKEKFHYTIGNEKGNQIQEEKTPVLYFDGKKGDIARQYTDIFEEALKYRFSTSLQFQTILRSMGVNIEFTEGNNFHILFEGLDATGKKSNPRITERDLGIDAFGLYEKALKANNSKKKNLSKEEKEKADWNKYQIGRTIAFCMEHARTENHFVRMLQKKGIAVTLSRSADGSVFGATFADRQSRTAYKASELKYFVNADALKKAAAPGGDWERNERTFHEEWKAKLQEKRIQKNMNLAALQAEKYIEPVYPTTLQRTPEERRSFARIALNVIVEILSGTHPKRTPVRYNRRRVDVRTAPKIQMRPSRRKKPAKIR